MVVNIRKALMEGNEHESKYLGVCADAIRYRMEKLDFSNDEIPSVSTIKRIVKKHNLKVNKRERYKRVKSKKRYTIPRYLQVDNGMYFIGDFRYPRRFSRFIRICLYVGIEVVFIAPSSPWMNGSIENFNNWFGAKFWDKETFINLGDMRARSLHFVDQHNALSAWKKKDGELKQIEPLRFLKNAAEINLDKLPLTDGKIHFISKADNKGEINVLNEVFKVGDEFISEYVGATICMGKRKIWVYYRAQDRSAPILIKEFEYDVNERISPIRQDIWKT